MSKTGFPKRSVSMANGRSARVWDRAVLLTGVQIVVAGAVLIGGAAAMRAIHTPTHRDPDLIAITDRAAQVPTRAAERYVLDRSAKAITMPQPTEAAVSSSAAVIESEAPQLEFDLLPPLARANFSELLSNIDSTATDFAATSPPETAKASVLHIETAVSDTPAMAIVTDVEEKAPKPRLKRKMLDADAKRHRYDEAVDEHKIAHRAMEVRYASEQRRDYIAPTRIALASGWRGGVCTGGPARWVGNRIYWGHRC